MDGAIPDTTDMLLIDVLHHRLTSLHTPLRPTHMHTTNVHVRLSAIAVWAWKLTDTGCARITHLW
jgi:uncharacterized protein (DUF2461 family)